MAYKKRRQRKSKSRPKSAVRRFRSRVRKTRSTGKGPNKPPLGNKYKVYTRYVETPILVDNTAGYPQTTNHVFSCNSLYDPYRTGTGHQPLGFDQYMLMFNHYTVIASKIHVYFENEDSSYGALVGVSIRDRSGTGNDADNLIENGNVSWKYLSPKGANSATGRVTRGVNISKWMGRPGILSEDDLRGDVTSNPSEEIYYHVFVSSLAPAVTNPAQVLVHVRIDYIAVLTEPKRLDAS